VLFNGRGLRLGDDVVSAAANWMSLNPLLMIFCGKVYGTPELFSGSVSLKDIQGDTPF
jgi:hypothetical protein